ncbi:tumor protein p53-inducible protein 13 isoform X4 [Ursus maritimus]|uniref:Tumor protein p53-inducible protein 13 isoform X4 n=1 Tax=Ursus maritimus TaxID=29073 RepID=A0A8M1H0E5_URSMA|nr:tumor protein p53-inducible protein 13 isoform X4 [Ursus maritimus]
MIAGHTDVSEAGCRRSVPVSPPGPLGPLGSHFPPFAPLHDPTQALQLRSAGRGDALGRKRGRRKGPLRSRSAVHWGRDPAQNFSGFDFRTRARKVVAEPEEEAGARCPEGLWPLPPQVSPRVTYARRSRWQAEDVGFLYHPCAHPWLKLQLALLAHVCVAQPSLAPDSSLTRERPLALAAWGVALEMAWVEPARAAHLLKRRRRRRQRKEKAWLCSDGLSGSLVPRPGRGRLCWRGCVQAPALAFPLRSWRPPGAEEATRGPRHLSPGGAKRRGLRAALGLQPTPSGLRFPSASPRSLEAKQPMLAARGERGDAPSVPTLPLLPEGLGGNASSRIGAQVPKGQSSPGGCTCPGEASPAPRAAAPPPRVARGPTPRTEEAAWAAMALTFLLVLLALATLCTRLHRNFRRGESIYWEPTADSQDTVAAVLKRRLLMPPRRVKRSRRRPLLPPTPDSGPDGDSSD